MTCGASAQDAVAVRKSINEAARNSLQNIVVSSLAVARDESGWYLEIQQEASYLRLFCEQLPP
jgi:hypothetical protein